MIRRLACVVGMAWTAGCYSTASVWDVRGATEDEFRAMSLAADEWSEATKGRVSIELVRGAPELGSSIRMMPHSVFAREGVYRGVASDSGGSCYVPAVGAPTIRMVITDDLDWLRIVALHELGHCAAGIHGHIARGEGIMGPGDPMPEHLTPADLAAYDEASR